MISAIELFSGAGGLALGLHEAGFEHKALFEWDHNSCSNINANAKNGFSGIKDWNVVETDVRLVCYDELGTKVHMVSGGPPCQPFSLGGNHQAHNDHRDMFPEAVRAVRELKPRAFIFENVKGLLRKSFSSYFNYIYLQLTYPEIVKDNNMPWTDHLRLLEEYHTSGRHDGLAYNVVFRLLNSADFGVPQARHRVFIVGFRNDLNANWSFPNETHFREGLLEAKWIDNSYWEEHRVAKKDRPQVSLKEMDKIKRLVTNKKEELIQRNIPFSRWETVRDAIKGLPDPRNDNEPSRYYNHEFRPGAKTYPGHSGSVLDEPSKTIKAGAHGVPGGENMLILDDGSIRYYTVRESARIQTFPDDYQFYASWTESMRQIGNAVPVRLAHAVGSSVAKQLERIDENGFG